MRALGPWLMYPAGNTVPLMKTDQDLLLPSDFLRDTTKIPFRPGKTVTVFIMGSIAHNLSRSCRQASTTVETDPSPEVIRMKQKYANYMGEELQQLNRDIANPATYGITGVFSRLIGLIASEVRFQLSFCGQALTTVDGNKLTKSSSAYARLHHIACSQWRR